MVFSLKKFLKDLEAENENRRKASSIVPLRDPAPARSLFAGSKATDNVLGKTLRKATSAKLSHQVLDKHTSIAWDLDDTLINGKQSWFWRRWIIDNHQNRKFWILTFRTSQLDDVWIELESCDDPVSPEWFKSIIGVPKVLWNGWVGLPISLREIDYEYKIDHQVAKLIKQTNHKIADVIDINRAIRAWKAAMCKQLGCTALVEDRERFCKPYCDLVGVEFVNAVKD